MLFQITVNICGPLLFLTSAAFSCLLHVIRLQNASMRAGCPDSEWCEVEAICWHEQGHTDKHHKKRIGKSVDMTGNAVCVCVSVNILSVM